MAKNYYEILDLSRDANGPSVCNAYRRLALQWNPNTNRENLMAANYMFHQISEAFEVLSDQATRTIYDELGEFGLKAGIYGQKGYVYKGNAEEIHNGLFSAANPFFEDSAPEPGSLFGQAARGLNMPPEAVPEDIVIELHCTLEELYNGCMKTVTYSARKVNSDRVTFHCEETTREITVDRGAGKGTRVICKQQGNEAVKYETSDLIVLVRELPHKVFRKEGVDLVCLIHIPLASALLSDPLRIVNSI